MSAHPILDNLARYHALDTFTRLCREYGCTRDDVMGPSRLRSVVQCRHHMWRLLRDTLDLSYPEIARIWRADHTSIIMGVRQAKSRLDPDENHTIGKLDSEGA